MEYSYVTYTTLLCASLTWGVAARVFPRLSAQNDVYRLIKIACMINAVWWFLISLCNLSIFFSPSNIPVGESIRSVVWIFALTLTLKQLSNNQLPLMLKTLLFTSLLCLFMTLVIYRSATSLNIALTPIIWINLLLATLALISVEQLYKNVSKSRPVRLIGIILAVMLIYDIYFYSHSLIFNGHIDKDLWQVRAVIAACGGFVIALSGLLPPKTVEGSPFCFSRPIIIYTTSLTTAGGFIIMLALGGYYVKLYGGNWGTVIYTLLLFMALIIIAIIFASETIREILRVLISKHLFRHKYDYRAEWLRLIHHLSQPVTPENLHQRALEAISTVFKSPGGAIWLLQETKFVPVYENLCHQYKPLSTEPSDSTFCEIMREDEWIFILQSNLDAAHNQYNEYLPEWVQKIPKLWIIFPLLVEHELIGFIALNQPKIDASLTWEDLDLLKTIARQVASFLERHKQAEQLAVSSQFDAFNKLAAFIMHDLKNLIAQQALVVRNAARHKNNPDFFEDAIRTIDNSVTRMNSLLNKFQHQQFGDSVIKLSLQNVVAEAVKQCENENPKPAFISQGDDLILKADRDRLVMAINHLIKNAQEATPPDGQVIVTLRNEENIAMITIEDTGKGMDTTFIRQHLFKPFNTTKAGKGMGMGVYQAKTYLMSLGGELTVESEPNQGTTFTMLLKPYWDEPINE